VASGGLYRPLAEATVIPWVLRPGRSIYRNCAGDGVGRQTWK
jgi:hypothetical protein